MASHILPDTHQRSVQHGSSAVIKRSVVVGGHKTSVSLEDAFWTGLKDIARSRDMSLSGMLDFIDGHRNCGNLSSTIRLFVLEYARAEKDASTVGAASRSVKHEPHSIC
jgi:predicted DNA-binding ribbon-helix-helix protein